MERQGKPRFRNVATFIQRWEKAESTFSEEEYISTDHKFNILLLYLGIGCIAHL